MSRVVLVFGFFTGQEAGNAGAGTQAARWMRVAVSAVRGYSI